MQYVIGLDEGTTGITALLYTQNGKLAGRAYKELPINFPQSGWVEQNPEEIFELTVDTIRHLLKDQAIHTSDIAALGLTNQRETSVLWDKQNSQSLGPAISWQCKRSMSICQEWKNQGLEELVRKNTGLLIDSYFSASKIKWMLDNINGVKPSLAKKTLAFGTVDSWLLWKLSGGKTHATDITNASRTMLFDLTSKTWSVKLGQKLGVPQEILPQILPSRAHFGTIAAEFFGHEIPVSAVMGDQQSALFAHHGTSPGMGKCTFGTGAFFLMYHGIQRVPAPPGILETAACTEGGDLAYAHEGSIFMAGAIVQWLRDQLGIIIHAGETEAMIREVQKDHEVVMVPAFTGLGSPYWNENVRASFFGMSRKTKKHHLVKAAIEAIAFQVYDLVSSLNVSATQALKKLGVDGGVTQNLYFCQFLADILNIIIEKADMPDMTALGAAKLAATQTPFGKGFTPENKTQTFVPQVTETDRAFRLKRWKNAVEATLRFHHGA